MNLQLLRSLTCCALAAFLVAAGFVGVTHFHFAGQASGDAHVTAATCSCHVHRHPPSDDQSPAPGSDNCHFCELLTQLSAETPNSVEISLSCLVLRAGFDLDVAKPVAVAAVYMGRGPPLA